MTAPSPFRLQVPTRLIFGVGERRRLGSEGRRFGKRAAIVTGSRSLTSSGRAGEIEALLTAEGLEIVDRIAVGGEPDDESVTAAADRFVSAGVEVVLAIGGGSVIDLAKAAGVLPGSGKRIEDLLAGASVDDHVGVPVIAAPTTAGTGAELSWGAIVLDRGAERKRGIRGAGVSARVAVVDPELTASADARLTAEAGFDALAHCIETSASRASHWFVRAQAADALRRLTTGVPAAMDAPKDLRWRSENAYAAAMMGINLATSTTCLPHRLQYPVGALTGTSHPLGVAALMPAWLDRTVRHAPASLAPLARGAGLTAASADDLTAARALRDSVRELMASTGMEVQLADLGVERTDIAGLVARVEGSIANDPGPTGLDDLAALYRDSL